MQKNSGMAGNGNVPQAQQPFHELLPSLFYLLNVDHHLGGNGACVARYPKQ
jgi:hypothetical protein